MTTTARTSRDVRGLGAGSTGLGAAIITLIAGTCCVSPVLAPLIVGVLGASGAAWAAGLKPYSVYILATTLLLLVYGFWSVYRTRNDCIVEGNKSATPHWMSRLSKGVLWTGAACWFGAVVVQIAIR